MKASAPAAGLELKGIESFTTGDQDFTLQLTRIVEQNPDLFYLAATTDEAALAISQARDLGIKAQILGGAGLNDPRIGALAKAGAYGTITFAPFSPKDDRPVVKAFVCGIPEKIRHGRAAGLCRAGLRRGDAAGRRRPPGWFDGP